MDIRDTGCLDESLVPPGGGGSALDAVGGLRHLRRVPVSQVVLAPAASAHGAGESLADGPRTEDSGR